jgi:hypothetical protein
MEGLIMSDVVSLTSGTADRSDHLLARLVGVIVSPRATFEAIVTQPHWFGALALVTVTFSVGFVLLLSTNAGQMAFLDWRVQQAEQFGRPVSDGEYQRLQREPPTPIAIGTATLAAVPIAASVGAALLLAAFRGSRSRKAAYASILAVASYSAGVLVVRQLVTLPLNYLYGSLSSPTNFGVFAQAILDDTSFFARFFGMIDLFIIWWLAVLAIGLSVLYRRRTAPIFCSLMGVYIAIAIVIAGVMRGPSGGA